MAAMSLSERLRQAADRCCQNEGFEAMEASNRLFLDLLESPLHDRELKQASPEKWLTECEQALQQAGELLDPSSSSGLVLCEKIGLELPRVLVKFVSLSQVCQDHCLSIVKALAENCSPREMFTAFMEALNMYTAPQTLVCCIPLVQGLSLAFSRLQRRQARFFQEASSGLLALVRLTVQDEGDDEEDEEETFIETVQGMDGQNVVPLELVNAAVIKKIVQLAHIVREACDAVDVDEQREDFQRRLGMFALQILGITGEKIARPEWEVPVSMMELVALLPFCNLSICLLLTKDQIEVLVEMTSDGSTDERAKNEQRKIEATKGAALAG